jgi:CDP-glucose 4,6-dehydratase
MFKSYNNKKILVTGHTGFKGSWLSIWLLNLGAKVIGYSLDPKNNKDNFQMSGLKEKLIDYRSDVRDYNRLNEVVQKEKPEIIFHLAAQSLVLESYQNPLSTIETNTLGTVNILESFRNSSYAKTLILVTTDKVYDNDESGNSYKEIDRLGGKDPYSTSKSAAELLIKGYIDSYFSSGNKNVASVRAGNVIGGGDWSENRIIPDSITAIENSTDIIVRNPSFTRPWQHLLEPLSGYLLLAEKLNNGTKDFIGSWNFGPEDSQSINVESLVEKIISCYGKGSYKINNENNLSLEAKLLSLNIDKAKKYLDWKPLLSFDKTIELTIEWYKSYKNSDIFDLCSKQILEYEEIWKSEN